jgi:uncharacterized RDD family membrane protein YckC
MDTGSGPPEPWLPPRPPGPEPELRPRPEVPEPYGGPVPPGGWQQPQPSKSGEWAGQPLAGWWSRVGATLLDWLILIVAVIAVAIPVALVTPDDVDEAVFWIIGSAVYVVALGLYAPLLMSRSGKRNGQTLGRQAAGIRVVRDDGEPVAFGFAFVREVVVKWFLFGVVGGFFFIPTILDDLWPLWDGENRALHDMLVSSHVVRA